MVDEDEKSKHSALLNPLELCISAIKEALRAPLDRYGRVMFERGVRWERSRQNAQSFDPDKTPKRPFRLVEAEDVVGSESDDRRDKS